MTAQDIFDTVARHLFAQGQQALDAVGNCSYRGANGSMCAVGCLIKDDEYDPAMDSKALIEQLPGHCNFNGTTVHGLRDVGLLPERLRPHVELLSELQTIHDTTVELTAKDRFSRRSLRSELRGFARSHGLDTSILNTL